MLITPETVAGFSFSAVPAKIQQTDDNFAGGG